MAASFRQWLRQWREAREARQRERDKAARKVQLEVDPLEKRWVPNDVFGLLRTVLPGLALGLAGQKALGKLLDEPNTHRATPGDAGAKPLADQIAALALSFPRQTPASEPAADSAPRKERPAQTPAERGDDWPAFAKNLFDDLSGRDTQAPASAGDGVRHDGLVGGGAGGGSGSSHAPGGGSRGSRQGGNNAAGDLVVPPAQGTPGRGGNERPGKTRPGGDPLPAGPAAPGVVLLGDGADPGGTQPGGEPGDGTPPGDNPRVPRDAILPAQLDAQFAAQPLAFEANAGQAPGEVQFLARAKGYTTYLTADGPVVVLAPTPQARAEDPVNPAQDALRLAFVGADPAARAEGLQALPSRSNYFLGNEASGWRGDVAHFGQVVYRGVYPGVDVVYRGGDGNRLRFDLTVAPDADVGAIRIRLDGVSQARVNGRGELVLTTAHGEVTQRAPVLYQDVAGSRVTRTGRYVLNDGGEVGFAVDHYDRSRPLVIDPTLDYSSYLGGVGNDQGNAVAVDLQGNIYITGSATSASNFPFPSGGGGFQSTLNGTQDVFVSKLSASGALIYSTFVGGSTSFAEEGLAVAADAAGNAYITGRTLASDYPTTSGAYDTSWSYDTFVSKISPAGNALVWSTFLGGSSVTLPDVGRAIAVDGSGAVYVAGETNDTNFPTTSGAFDGTHNGTGSSVIDAFVTRLKPDGSGLLYSSYLGGSGTDVAYGLAVSPSGVAYVVGSTTSTNFPTQNAFQSTAPASTNGFVTALNVATGASGAVYSTYLGGTGTDEARAVAVDSSGQAYVTGSTQSSNFPTSVGAFDATLGTSGTGTDAFVTRLAAGGALGYSSFLGGANGEEAGHGIGLDKDGYAHVVGLTKSNDFPTVGATGAGTAYGGGLTDAFVSRVSPGGTSLAFSTFLGGTGDDQANAAAVDPDGRTVVAGTTTSANFPVTLTAAQSTNRGGSDAFVARYGAAPDAPVITTITTDSGASASDFITNDTTLTISGTADPLATVTLNLAGVGDLPNPVVAASPSGLWTYTYSTTLTEGVHDFSARTLLSGRTGPTSAHKLVTVDLTAPLVTHTVAATTYDTTPVVRVTASDRGGIPASTTVTLDVDLDNNGSFAGGELDYKTVTFTNGTAEFEVTPALTVGNTVGVRARVTDLAGNVGTSTSSTVQVQSITNPTLTGTVGLASPFGGDPLLYQGAASVSQPLDLDCAPGAAMGGYPALVWDGRRVSVKPVVQAAFQTANDAPLSSHILGTLTWASSVTTFSYATSLRSPGDLLTVALQVPTAQTAPGRYAWTLEVAMNYGTPVVRTATGYAYVAPEDTNNAYGAGWGFSHVDRLYPIADGGVGQPAGVLRAFGAGGWAFYQDTGSGNYTEPQGDNGTLTSTTGGVVTTYTYTAPDGSTRTFNNDGMQTGWASADGKSLLTFTYTNADGDGLNDDLATQANVSGSVATFTYASNKLRTITATGPRTVTLTHSGSDLVSVQNPDGGLHTFSYDATSRQLTGSQFDTLANSYTYAQNMVSAIVWGGGLMTQPSTSPLKPALWQGLTTLVAGTAEAVLTDPTSNATKTTFDAAGRWLTSLAADGGLSRTARDGNGWVTSATDPLNRTTTYTLDALGYVTQVKFPDNSTRNYQYQTNFHALVSMTDERSNTTQWAYDAQGHLTTFTNAKSETTTYAYDGTTGMLTSVTDAGGHRTDYAYSGCRALTSVTDALGNKVTYTYDDNGNLKTVTDQLNRVTTYANDAMARPTVVTNPLSGVASMVWSKAGLLQESQDEMGRKAQYAHDARGLVTSSVEAVGTPVQVSKIPQYDAAGRRNGSRDANGVWSYSGHDAVGRPKTSTNALGYGTDSAYDLAGQMTAGRDEMGRWTSYGYNNRGWLTTVRDALGGVTTYGYDPAGNRTSVINPRGHTWTYEYDQLNRQTAAEDPLANRVETAFDEDGLVTEVTDARGHVTRHSYDALHRLTGTTEAYGTPAERSRSWEYDKVGNLTTFTNAESVVTAYAVDKLDRVTAATEAHGTGLARTFETTYDAVGNVVTVKDPLNRTTSFTSDARNRTAAVTDPLGLTTNILRDAVGRQVGTVNPKGEASVTALDVLGRPAFAIDPLGNTSRVQYDPAGNVVGSADPRGNASSDVVDALNRPVKRTDALTHSTQSAYDAAGNVTTTTDQFNKVTTYAYDELGRLTSVTRPVVGTSTTEYDQNGNVTATVDPMTRRTEFLYDERDRLTTVIDAQTRRATTVYDDEDRVVSSTNRVNKTTSFDYDDLGRLTTTTDPLGKKATSVYDPADQLTASIDKRNKQTSYAYDNGGRLTRATDPLSHSTDTSYDEAGRPTLTIDARGFRTTIQYDAAGRRTSVQDPAGTTALAYDAAGNVTASTDAAGAVTALTLDALNRVTLTSKPGAGTTSAVFDAAGRLVAQVDGLNKRTTFMYDDAGRRTSVQDALGFLTATEYDDNGNVTEVTDPEGNTTAFEYDTLDRLTETTDPLNKSGTFAYDFEGRLTSRTDRLGQRRDFAFDDAGRMTAETWRNSGGTVTDRVTFTYDDEGNVLSARNENVTYTYAYDDAGRVTTQADTFGGTLTFSYDFSGHRTRVQDSFGGVVSSSYDGAGRLTQRDLDLAGTSSDVRVDFDYTPRGQLATLTRYSDLAGTAKVGETTLAYDASGRTTGIRHNNGAGTALATYSYGYDNADRVTTESSAAGTKNYSYDNADQVTNDSTSSYDYDDNGNRDSAGYTTGLGNRISNDGTWTYTYDDNGNLTKKSKGPNKRTWKFTYDEGGRLTRAAKRTEDVGGTLEYEADYKYDAFGRRIETAVDDDGVGSGNTVIRHFSYDGTDVWAEMSNANALLTRRMFGDGGEVLLRETSGTVRHYHLDRLGSVRDMTNSTGSLINHLDYDAFGNILTETGPSFGDRYSYAMLLRDSTDLYYGWHRYYDPATGRWLSEDPIGFSAGDVNLSRYVGNNPTNRIDPTGLFWPGAVQGGVALGNAFAAMASKPGELLLKASTLPMGAPTAFPPRGAYRLPPTPKGAMLRVQRPIGYHNVSGGVYDPYAIVYDFLLSGSTNEDVAKMALGGAKIGAAFPITYFEKMQEICDKLHGDGWKPIPVEFRLTGLEFLDVLKGVGFGHEPRLENRIFVPVITRPIDGNDAIHTFEELSVDGGKMPVAHFLVKGYWVFKCTDGKQVSKKYGIRVEGERVMTNVHSPYDYQFAAAIQELRKKYQTRVDNKEIASFYFGRPASVKFAVGMSKEDMSLLTEDVSKYLRFSPNNQGTDLVIVE